MFNVIYTVTHMTDKYIFKDPFGIKYVKIDFI